MARGAPIDGRVAWIPYDLFDGTKDFCRAPRNTPFTLAFDPHTSRPLGWWLLPELDHSGFGVVAAESRRVPRPVRVAVWGSSRAFQQARAPLAEVDPPSHVAATDDRLSFLMLAGVAAGHRPAQVGPGKWLAAILRGPNRSC